MGNVHGDKTGQQSNRSWKLTPKVDKILVFNPRLQNSPTSKNRWKRNARVFWGESATSNGTSTVNATCYRYGPGCGYDDGQEVVNGV